MGPVVTIGYVLARDYQIQTQIDNMRRRTKDIRDQNLGTLKATYSDICNIVSLSTSDQCLHVVILCLILGQVNYIHPRMCHRLNLFRRDGIFSVLVA